jgi:hypothetical protein
MFSLFFFFKVVASERLMAWLKAFICELAHKEKYADTTSGI